MTDIFQTQEDFFQFLLSAPRFRRVNVVNERRLLADASVEFDSIWTTPRNGGVGNGLFVREPKVKNLSPAAPAPLYEITIPVECFQAGHTAFNPVDTMGNSGGGFSAPQLAFAVIDELYQWQVDGVGIVLFEDAAYEPTYEYDGLNAVRVNARVRLAGSAPTARASYVTTDANAGTVTLTCLTTGAALYYTLDGSFPAGPEALNPLTGAPVNAASLLYTAPITPAPGVVIRSAAYSAGLRIGPVRRFVVPNP